VARAPLVAQRRRGEARPARGKASLCSGAWPALAAVYVVWGSTYLGIDLAVRTIPPFLMAAIRFLAAGPLLYVWATRRGDRSDRPTVRHWVSAFLIAVPMLAIGNAAVGWAEQTLDTGTASLIIASVPLWMAVLDRVFYAQRLARVTVIGLVVGFGGVGLLVAPGGAGGGSSRASIVLVFSSLAWAIGSLYSRHAPQPQRPLVSAGMQMTAGGLILAVVSVASGEVSGFHVSNVSLESWLGLAYLVVAGSLVAFTAYMWLLRAAPTSLVGTYAYVNPVVAVLLGAFVLGEPLTWRTLVGGGIILAAVALIVRAPKPQTALARGRRPAAAVARAR
jgi:drug/metabolite transporter (DMT)-like permease